MTKVLYFFVDSSKSLDCVDQEPEIELVEVDVSSNVQVIRVHVEKESGEASRYNVNSVPTTLVVNDSDSVVERFEGVTDAQKIVSAAESA